MTGTTKETYAERRARLRAHAMSLIIDLDNGIDEVAGEAGEIVRRLKIEREFDLLDRLADALRAYGDDDGRLTKEVGQALIEIGRPRLAVDVLNGLIARMPEGGTVWIDAKGVLGRAWKQQYLDTSDRENTRAHVSFHASVAAYASAYDASGCTNDYVGVNLVALLAYAEKKGRRVCYDRTALNVAKEIELCLRGKPKEDRDEWYHASMAEIAIALGDFERAEAYITEYLTFEGLTAFGLHGTLRQFTELWRLGAEPGRGRNIVDALRAATLRLPGGYVEMTPEVLQRILDDPEEQRVQTILGHDGQVTHRLLLTGIGHAASVALIEHRGTTPIGTGFLVRAGDFIPVLGDEICLLTNSHVVGREDPKAAPPEECEAVFQLPGPNRTRIAITEEIWSSPAGKLDATLLRLAPGIELAVGLPLAKYLPTLDGKSRVYVIGHPEGRELTYSLQDNRLLDHEGPTAGTPVDPKVRKLHYRAPTEHGSSGSPVFNSRWDVIGLHRAGGKLQRLNGNSDEWPANEGVWIQSIRDAAATSAEGACAAAAAKKPLVQCPDPIGGITVKRSPGFFKRLVDAVRGPGHRRPNERR
ncbi:hypothetical protein F4693_000721 [Sphingomonas endophytica]|uniref:Serine protease n=1 Tax=Sphingomonas endophytica TaxID=869719 RepID=A0A7X0J9Y4_9SPHN|nr:serine protease [Sphingomonas endophytica]MBB6503766.1 hypothetical protein [Sphingomonas endophytica]